MLISVIIATYNRTEDLKKVLNGLLHQELPWGLDYEIIVVDNHPMARSQAAVEGMMEQADGKLRYYHQQEVGKSKAMNRALSHARGDILAFTDDDVLVGPSWLASVVECFQKTGCDALGGRVLPIYPSNTPLWVREFPHQMAGVVVIYDQGDSSYPVNDRTERFIGCNWSFKRDVFASCGIFREDLGPGMPLMGEDEEYFQRMLKLNKKLHYCAEALIMHPVDLRRLTLKNVAVWHIALGRFDAQKEIEHHKEFVRYFGIPRYLLGGIVVDFIRIPCSILTNLMFLTAWRSFFRKIGMIQQYVSRKGTNA